MTPLIFPHVGSTGGATFLSILNRFFSNSRAFNEWDLDTLGDIQKDQLEQVEFLYGHMAFGAHQYFNRECAYISIARNPVIRVISEYYYWLEQGTKLGKDYLSNQTLMEYVQTRGYVNEHCLVYSGKMTQKKIIPVDRSILEMAKENIEKHFCLIGTAEQFDETLVLTKDILGLNHEDICYKNMIVSNIRPALMEVDKKIIDCIEEMESYDIELYKFIKNKLNLKIQEKGIFFDDDLSLFRKHRDRYLAEGTDNSREYPAVNTINTGTKIHCQVYIRAYRAPDVNVFEDGEGIHVTLGRKPYSHFAITTILPPTAARYQEVTIVYLVRLKVTNGAIDMGVIERNDKDFSLPPKSVSQADGETQVFLTGNANQNIGKIVFRNITDTTRPQFLIRSIEAWTADKKSGN